MTKFCMAKETRNRWKRNLYNGRNRNRVKRQSVIEKKSQTRLTEGLMSKAPKELKKLNIKEII